MNDKHDPKHDPSFIDHATAGEFNPPLSPRELVFFVTLNTLRTNYLLQNVTLHYIINELKEGRTPSVGTLHQVGSTTTDEAPTATAGDATDSEAV